MKRLLALLLALLMLIVISGCAKKNNSPESDTSEVTAEVTDEVKDTVKIPDTPKPIEAKLTRGKVEGQKYTSAYTGLRFTAPEGWEYSADTDMAELLNMSAEMLSEEKIAETLTNTTTVFDMIVTDKSNGNNVTVSYENMDRICGKAVDAAEYVDVLKERIDAQMQVEYEFRNEGAVTLSGNEYQRVEVLLKTSNFEMVQGYYIRIIDDVAVCINTTLIGDTALADVEAMFE